jgi:hypothetical protein
MGNIIMSFMNVINEEISDDNLLKIQKAMVLHDLTFDEAIGLCIGSLDRYDGETLASLNGKHPDTESLLYWLHDDQVFDANDLDGMLIELQEAMEQASNCAEAIADADNWEYCEPYVYHSKEEYVGDYNADLEKNKKRIEEAKSEISDLRAEYETAHPGRVWNYELASFIKWHNRFESNIFKLSNDILYLLD